MMRVASAGGIAEERRELAAHLLVSCLARGG
jgi:hypothetical protein